ncbi:uncharacterized protein METZ01_LOCUS402082, partial [marine metagenome]
SSFFDKSEELHPNINTNIENNIR